MNKNSAFDPYKYYETYPAKVISRPGYPARAAYKSTLAWSLFGERIINDIGKIKTYADIGGCFGFGANSMMFQINKAQQTLPRTVVFEISSDFVKIGEILFPKIEFLKTEFGEDFCDIELFDLVTLFDLVEHVLEPEAFLHKVATHSKYVILITPMETSGEWRGSKPPLLQGDDHEDGHINFFSPSTYEDLLKRCNLNIIKSYLVPNIYPPGAELVLNPEWITKPKGIKNYLRHPKELFYLTIRLLPAIPFRLKRRILGRGVHIALCRVH